MNTEDREFVERVEKADLQKMVLENRDIIGVEEMSARLCRIIRALEAENALLKELSASSLKCVESSYAVRNELNKEINKISAKLAAMEKERGEAPVVYGRYDKIPNVFREVRALSKCTHKGRLVDIQPIEKGEK